MRGRFWAATTPCGCAWALKLLWAKEWQVRR